MGGSVAEGTHGKKGGVCLLKPARKNEIRRTCLQDGETETSHRMLVRLSGYVTRWLKEVNDRHRLRWNRVQQGKK